MIGIIALTLWFGTATFVVGGLLGINYGIQHEKDRRMREGR